MKIKTIGTLAAAALFTGSLRVVQAEEAKKPAAKPAKREAAKESDRPSRESIIKRLDKEPIHDWRDLQQIKNEVMGEEAEAIEIYPAESRKMDVANQYHLFAFTTKIPIGFVGRAVESSAKAEQVGAKQRAL